MKKLGEIFLMTPLEPEDVPFGKLGRFMLSERLKKILPYDSLGMICPREPVFSAHVAHVNLKDGLTFKDCLGKLVENMVVIQKNEYDPDGIHDDTPDEYQDNYCYKLDIVEYNEDELMMNGKTRKENEEWLQKEVDEENDILMRIGDTDMTRRIIYE